MFINNHMSKINPYFAEFANGNEQNLLNNITKEIIQIHGMELRYLPRSILEEDRVLGEITQSIFDDSYPLEFYLENTDTFIGEDLLSDIGIDLKTSFSFEVHKERFEEEVTYNEPDIIRPREGDLLYVPMNNSIYEITSVRKWEEYFMFQKRFTWKINCELYTDDGDIIDTGDKQVDSVIEDIQQPENQANANNSAEPDIEDEVINDDWLDTTIDNPFGEVFDDD